MASLIRPAALLGALDGLPVAVTRLAAVLLALKVGRTLYDAASFAAVYMRPSQLHRYIYPDAQGRAPWALVTGASDGVGVAFADELAAAGLNVVLHGRNEVKLDAVRQQLASRHPQREFRLLVADATEVCTPAPAVEVDSLVDAHLAGLHLTVLINNAGGGLRDPIYAPLADTASDRIFSNVMLNGMFPTLLIARTLPLFQRAQTPALIMNISSLADNGMPFIAPYGAAKVFVTTVTSMVRRELEISGLGGRGGNIQILAVRFGVVTGVSHHKTAPSFFVPDTNTMARASLARTGSGRDLVVGYFPHALLNLSMQFMPGWLQERVFKQVMITRRDEEIRQSAKQKDL